MHNSLIKIGRRILQESIIFLARPYIRYEFPGWGMVYSTLVGDYRRDYIWKDSPEKVIRGKIHGFIMHLDMAHWGDRMAYFLGRWYELETQLFMADLVCPGDTVVDIGANRGMFTLYASRLVGISGKVFSFEPNPHSLKQLTRELESNSINNVTIHPYGVSNEATTLELYVPFTNSGEGTFAKALESQVDRYKVEAKLVAGDTMLNDEQPALIKIDVEGYECHVIEGLSETLNRHHPIIIMEIVSEHLLSCGSNVQKLVQMMKCFGYVGYQLLLEKSSHNRVWALKPIVMDGYGYNSVWIHDSARADSLKTIIQRIRTL